MGLKPVISLCTVLLLLQMAGATYNLSTEEFKQTVLMHWQNSGRVRISVYDIQGREVARLMDRNLLAGFHNISLNRINKQGLELSPNVYFLKDKSPDKSDTRRLFKIR